MFKYFCASVNSETVIRWVPKSICLCVDCIAWLCELWRSIVKKQWRMIDSSLVMMIYGGIGIEIERKKEKNYLWCIYHLLKKLVDLSFMYLVTPCRMISDLRFSVQTSQLMQIARDPKFPPLFGHQDKIIPSPCHLTRGGRVVTVHSDKNNSINFYLVENKIRWKENI